MPGLFTSRGDCESSRPRLFEPAPRYAFATETSSRQVTDSDHETRKRSCNNDAFGLPPSTTPSTFNTTDLWAPSLGCSRFSDAKSPPPLADDRYALAGGMEVTGGFARHNEDYDDYFTLKKQRGMWSLPTSPNSCLPHLQTGEIQLSPSDTKPWMFNQLMSIVGGVAGKFVQFCTVPFRGFQAGDGQAYIFENREVAAKLGLQDNLFLDQAIQTTQQPLPGDFPQDDYGVLSIESLENERPRMSKRLRTGESWVVVDADGEMESRPSTPRLSERRVPDHTRSPSQIPRPVSSRAGASTPVLKRPSLIPVSRRSTYERKSFQGALTEANPSFGTPRTYSRQSYGSPVMFEDRTKTNKSPLPAESQRLINKVRREELEEDARMRRMSSQMSEMLREAREALGSSIAFEDECMDDGADDDLHSRHMKMFPR